MDAEFDNIDFIATAANPDRPPDRQRDVDQGERSKVVQPKPQALPNRQGPSAILVSTRQKGNPILNFIKSLPWEYSDIPCDYVLGATTCALFLSLKYHRLHPEYIYGRIGQLGKLYNLRIMLTMVDIENHEQALQELSKTSMINNFTLILAWSAQEAGRYIELFKSYEHASPSSIRARQAESWQESLTEFVTTPRNINKTDAASLISNFGSLRGAVNAEPDQLALIPGWGEKKVRSWYTTVREPFRVKRTARQNAQLLRHQSSAFSEDGNATPEHPILNAKPIGRAISGLDPESNKSTSNAGEMNSLGSHKKPRLQEIVPGDEFDEDDEEAWFAAEAAANNSLIQPIDVSEKISPKPIREELRLSDSVAAALAKYRNT